MVTVSAARRLGRYELGEIIGTGGVAEVVRAHVVGAGEFRKAVVIKRVRAELRDNTEVREAFRREALLAQRFHHANVVQALDLGDDDGLPYIVLELVDGCTLQRLLDDTSAGVPLPLAAVLHVTEQIAAALHYVHTLRADDGTPLGLVHRDVTPANVLLGRDGAVKLTDFGIARAAALGSDTLPGFIKGTALYLAPEQAAARPVDGRADLYALGLVLRRMLVGDHELTAIHPDLAAIVEAATEPAVRDRLACAEVMLHRVQQHRADVGIGSGAATIAAMVEAACRTPLRRTISLDRALGVAGQERTRQVASAAAPADGSHGSRRRAWWIGGLAVATVAVAALAWPSPQPDRSLRSPSAASTGPSPARPTDLAPQAEATPNGGQPPARSAPSLPPVVETPQTALEVAPAVAAKVPNPPDRARARGRLLINLVPYAEVSIDAKPVGSTPVDETLRSGKHTIELYNPETGRRKSLRVALDPGETLNITHW